MKKSLLTIFTVIATMLIVQLVMAAGERMTHVKSVNGATPKIMVKTGAFTVTGVQQTYTSMTNTGSAADTTIYTIGLYDCGNTYTATAWKVTLTVKGASQSNWFTQLGSGYLSTNGSNYGVISGVSFTAGVVMDGSVNGVEGGGVTFTAAVEGY
jgi:hypothetical protein